MSICFRGRLYLELAVEILTGGTGTESKLLKIVKPVKDAKAGKAGGKDGKTPAGGGAAGSAADADKGQSGAPEVLPVESPPTVGRSLFMFPSKNSELCSNSWFTKTFLM